ncbi:MAG: YtxH domain-containing protein [Coriobacteriia bacterium]|nr:YtxH domain-containing protein [Coriobacteriia bacterium]
MGRFVPFIVGGLVGACAAMAFTPRTGAENREYVMDQVENVKDSLAGVAGQSPQQVYQDVKESAANFAQEAKGTVEEKIADLKAGKSGEDELREKIEAARQRIADQVVQNAEESRAAVEEKVADVTEPVVEAISDVVEAATDAVAEAAEAAPEAAPAE